MILVRLSVVWAAAALLLTAAAFSARATWQPPPGYKPSPAVQAWFAAHQWCCLQAERVKARFRPIAKGQWEYSTDGFVWAPVTGAVFPEGVVPPAPHKETDPLFANDPQFQQLKTEGVLFVYKGADRCFFPPETTG